MVCLARSCRNYWQRVLISGTANGGENVSDSGGNTYYVMDDSLRWVGNIAGLGTSEAYLRGMLNERLIDLMVLPRGSSGN